jgi:hypothetical protein
VLSAILDNQWKKWQIIAVSVLIFFHLTVFAMSARPVQDDYSLLADISEKGLFGYLILVWETHGGNLTPMILNAGAISSALNSFNFITIAIFSIFTFLLVGVIGWIATTQIQMNGFRLPATLSLFLVLGTLFGFEGIFSPGLIGAYFFSSASAVHLWPVIFTLFGVYLASKKSSNILLAFVLGFFAGNSNIAESLAILIATFLLLVFPSKFSHDYSLLKLRLFISGVLLGAITIIASPGFWTRATQNTEDGIPGSFPEFVIRFSKSVSIFTVDILTHPALYIFLALGYLFQKKFRFDSPIFVKWNYIEILFFALLFSLILGATFAYPAWHQSLGLLLLLPCVSFTLGLRLGNQTEFFKPSSVSKITRVLVALLIVLIVRADILVLQSGRNWPGSNLTNICALREDVEARLSNPEIHYPFFNLGVEDVQTWPWIRATYVRWISNVGASDSIDCELVS